MILSTRWCKRSYKYPNNYYF